MRGEELTMPAGAPAGAYDPGLDRRVGAFHWAGFAALLRRELLRLYKLTAMVVLGPALMAIIYFACFAFGLGDQRGSAAGDAVLTFLMPGLIMLSVLLRAAENPGFSLLYSKMEGMVLDQLMSPLSARETVPVYVISGTCAGLVTGTTIWLCSLLLWPIPVQQPLTAVGFAVLGAANMAAMGILVGLASIKWDHFSAFFTFLFLPVSFLSGIFAPVATMPPLFQWVVQANPLFYAIDGFRYGMLGTNHQDPLVSVAVLAVCLAALLAFTLRVYASGWRLKH